MYIYSPFFKFYGHIDLINHFSKAIDIFYIGCFFVFYNRIFVGSGGNGQNLGG